MLTISTSYSNELWLLEDMTIAAVSYFRVLHSAASYITEYREYKGDEWPAHLVPVNILERWQSLIDKYQDCGDEELDAALKAIIYEPYLDEDEQELRTLTDSAVYKLSRITDDAFEKMDLIPEF